MRQLKVFYNEKQQVNDNTSFSPSAGKPKLVLEAWKALAPELVKVVESKRASRSTIALAHDIEYVDDVLSLRRTNGFSNKLASVAESLHYTTGSMTHAALDALRTHSVNASLTSGFHHACYNSGGGFCTFNGLVIAAQMLKLSGLLRKGKVGILDLDQHYGNGTEDIIKKLKLDYIQHWTLGGHQGLISDEKEENFKATDSEGRRVLKMLPDIFAEKFADCDIVLVQLGADSCKEDPLGHTFTVKEMLLRDQLVFKLLKMYDLPAAFNLAGGYQNPVQKVIDLHNFTLQAWAETFAKGLK